MNPITDAEVAELPLERGRSELMEAIMTTPVLTPDRSTQQSRPPRRPWRTALAVGAAAAAVAAIVATPLVLDRDEPAREAAPAGQGAPLEAGSPSGELVPQLADLPAGWQDALSDDKPIESVSTTRKVNTPDGPGALDFSVEVRPAAEYDSTVAGQTTQGSKPAGHIEIDGRDAALWTLTEKAGSGTGACQTAPTCVRHWTAISSVEDGRFIQVTGSGLSEGTMTEAEFRKLVRAVRIVVDP